VAFFFFFFPPTTLLRLRELIFFLPDFVFFPVGLPAMMSLLLPGAFALIAAR
jgi:hypothetical protein